jgi:hypothetical protein
MTLNKQQEAAFKSVKLALIGKYGKNEHRLPKDLDNLIKLREEQVMQYARQLALSVDGLTPDQIGKIKDRFTDG